MAIYKGRDWVMSCLFTTISPVACCLLLTAMPSTNNSKIIFWLNEDLQQLCQYCYLASFSDLAPSDKQNNGPTKVSFSFPLLPPAKLPLPGKKRLSVIIEVKDTKMGRLSRIIQLGLI